MAWLFLLGALLTGVLAPIASAGRHGPSYRQREARDLNAERYNAWRGRAERRPAHRCGRGMTGAERRSLWLAGALALAAAACLVAFFSLT